MDLEKPTEPREEVLQFETAEYAGAAPGVTACACAICGTSCARYWEVAGKVLCQACSDRVRAGPAGSGFVRLLRALGFGLAAAVAGCALWSGVAIVSGYEFGIIAIAVGLLVGGAVRAGCRRRGGWFYQGLAILLTYSAIIASYVPRAIMRFEEEAAVASATQSAPSAGGETRRKLRLSVRRIGKSSCGRMRASCARYSRPHSCLSSFS